MPKQEFTRVFRNDGYGPELVFIDQDGNEYLQREIDDSYWVDPMHGGRKTKAEAPYSYSEFYIWRDADLTHSTGDYTDRMQGWDMIGRSVWTACQGKDTTRDRSHSVSGYPAGSEPGSAAQAG
jgi:hypothetical protein